MDTKPFLTEEEPLKLAMMKLFKIIGFSEYRIHSIPTVLSILNNGRERTAYIVLVNTTDQGPVSKIYVDLIEGMPNHEQFYDVTYHFGADCKHKIVVFSTERDDDDYFEVKYIMRYQVRRNNRCGISTYLVRTDSGLNLGSHFFLIEAPNSSDFDVVKELPSEERLRWHDIDETYGFEDIGYDDNRYLVEYSDIIDRRIEITDLWIKPYITTRWAEDGLFLDLNRDDSSGDFLFGLWKAKGHTIQERYGISDATFDEAVCKISIKISPTPLSNFIYASWANQSELIILYRKERRLFVKFMDLMILEYRQ